MWIGLRPPAGISRWTARHRLTVLLGLDTGGTYTDAVLLDRQLGILASAKALTTHDDLAQGIGAAIDRIAPDVTAPIDLVALSTTLATNALVEGVSAPAALVLIGYDSAALTRAGLTEATAGSPVIMIGGGHNPSGDEQAPLDEAALQAAVRAHAGSVEAFAVSSYFAVRNPTHEHRARAIIRELTSHPVTCGHELTSKLDAPRRALTTFLNARLISRIARLIEAVRSILDARNIDAPLMIVRGDGSMMAAELAMERPVETILSGPAASAIGAHHLSGRCNAVIADIGGTTTDIALLRDGLPAVDSNGATVGGWRTMTEAIAVHSFGLGGDSEALFLEDGTLALGPRRVMPLSLLASQHPEVERALRRAAELPDAMPHDGRYVWRRETRSAALEQVSRIGRRILDRLPIVPTRLSDVIQSPADPTAIDRLIARGLVGAAGITPSDAAHVLGLHDAWSRDAAVAGMTLAVRGGARRAESPTSLAQSIYDRVVYQSAEAIVETLLFEQFGLARTAWGEGGALLVRQALAATRDSGVPVENAADAMRVGLTLCQSLVAVGAPAATYYADVARRLGAELVLPKGSDVANAIGAAVAGIRQKVQILITSPAQGLFRVHLATGVRDYRDLVSAIDVARASAAEQAQARASRAGSTAPNVKVDVQNRTIVDGAGSELFIDAIITATASGDA
jgi:N-methylhydantoinase A/oxoprolinase/acetone carboxylase beta subunit